jgi:hypothetical protein
MSIIIKFILILLIALKSVSFEYYDFFHSFIL